MFVVQKSKSKRSLCWFSDQIRNTDLSGYAHKYATEILSKKVGSCSEQKVDTDFDILPFLVL